MRDNVFLASSNVPFYEITFYEVREVYKMEKMLGILKQMIWMEKKSGFTMNPG